MFFISWRDPAGFWSEETDVVPSVWDKLDGWDTQDRENCEKVIAIDQAVRIPMYQDEQQKEQENERITTKPEVNFI